MIAVERACREGIRPSGCAIASALVPPTAPLLGAAPDLGERFDAVVMLTWSDWKNEPRSNRYHFATRFATCLPVIFVQEDDGASTWAFEPTEIPRVAILRVPAAGSSPRLMERNSRLLGDALASRGIHHPLLWAYSTQFSHFFLTSRAPLKVYHATEDYFDEGHFANGEALRHHLRCMLAGADLVVAVSAGVLDSYRRCGQYAGDAMVSTNGCDYAFLCAGPAGPVAERVIIYQGGINQRLDFPLMRDVARLLPDWRIELCGKIGFPEARDDLRAAWNELLAEPNVAYLGFLTAEKIRDRMRAATVGIMPFAPSAMVVKRSFPLKAFEYVACGLPVVTIAIDHLAPWRELFTVATGSADFAAKIRAAAATRCDEEQLARRVAAAASESYDAKFFQVASRLLTAVRPPCSATLDILILHDPGSGHVSTIAEHLASFRRHSRHRVAYAPATGGVELAASLDGFQAVIIHYSVRLSLADHLSPPVAAALRRYRGFKAAFIQDEYDCTEQARRWIEDLGIATVWTCVPTDQVEAVYPRRRFPHTAFLPTLTGYVPEDLPISAPPLPAAQRPTLIGYRGRRIGFWYGDLAQEKLDIGVRMRAICAQRGLAVDIEWEDDRRIYGPRWHAWLASLRATLGTESGANIFDWDGSLRWQVERALRRDPSLGYREIAERILAGREGEVRMNQVSPKIFEAIAARTALILFEGSYSGVLVPDRHFIPLRKDFANIEKVLERVADATALDEITANAYRDILESGRFSYLRFIAGIDEHLAREAPSQPFAPVVGQKTATGSERAPEAPLWLGSSPGLRGRLRAGWRLLPGSIRSRLFPMAVRIDSLLQARSLRSVTYGFAALTGCWLPQRMRGRVRTLLRRLGVFPGGS